LPLWTKPTRAGMSSQMGRHTLRNLFSGRSVPIRVGPLPFRIELPTDGVSDPFRIRPRENVRTDLEGLRSFRVFPQRHARDAEEATLLLEAARVGHPER